MLNMKTQRGNPTAGARSWCSGLRIHHCHCSGSGRCCGVGLIPGPGTATHHGQPPPQKKKNTKNNKKKRRNTGNLWLPLAVWREAHRDLRGRTKHTEEELPGQAEQQHETPGVGTEAARPGPPSLRAWKVDTNNHSGP